MNWFSRAYIGGVCCDVDLFGMFGGVCMGIALVIGEVNIEHMKPFIDDCSGFDFGVVHEKTPKPISSTFAFRSAKGVSSLLLSLFSTLH
jgi:hypothetical protein